MFVLVEKLGRNSWRNSVFGIKPNMVRERPFFACFLDGFDWQTLSDGGGGGGSSNTDWRTDGGDTRQGTVIGPSKHEAAARTTARKADRHGLDRLDEVAGRFERGGDAVATIDVAGHFGSTGDGAATIEGATALSMANSAVGDEMASIESSAGLAMPLRSIRSGGGVGGRDMVQWYWSVDVNIYCLVWFWYFGWRG